MANGRTDPKCKKVAMETPICSECSIATWQWKFEHLDLKGKPICLTCPHKEWWIIRGTEEPNCQYYVHCTPKNSVKPS